MQGFFNCEVEYLADVFTPIQYLQGFLVVALALAAIAGDIDIGEKLHFYFDQSIALTGFTASALDVKRKPPRIVAALTGHGHACKWLADGGKESRRGGWVTAGGAPNGALIDQDEFV